MRPTTRRRLIICALAVALTLPAESILLQALTTSDAKEAARNWAQSLSADQLKASAGAIESYPFVYRRAILRSLAPADRAEVWRHHIEVYIASHPNLDSSVVALLEYAASLATTDEFTTPTDVGRAQISIVAEQTTILLGKEDTLELFYRLGPHDVWFASGVPIGQQLANYVRGHFVVQADTEDCDCNTSFGCDGGGVAYCRGGVTCNRDENWPMCGWFWNQVCDGLCAVGLPG